MDLILRIFLISEGNNNITIHKIENYKILKLYTNITLKKLNYIILKTPKYLMQSVDLTYARYNYLNEIGEIITSNNIQNLFMVEKCFSKIIK